MKINLLNRKIDININKIMKIFTLRNFIFLTILFVIIYQVISRTSVPIMMPMENIDTILCTFHQREIPSYINMDLAAKEIVIRQIPPGIPVHQIDYTLLISAIVVLFEGSLISTAAVMSINADEPDEMFLTSHPYIAASYCLCINSVAILGILIAIYW